MPQDFYIEVPAESTIVQEPWEMELAGHVLGKLANEAGFDFDIKGEWNEDHQFFIWAGTEAPEELVAVIEAMAQGLPLGPLLEHILSERTEGQQP